MHYAIFEISGKQYLIKPGQVIEVDKLNTVEKSLNLDKVLLLADEKGVNIGTPYLKEGIKLEIVDTIKKAKVRVATYHAKANYRRVKGSRREVTRVKLAGEASKPAKKSVKKS